MDIMDIKKFTENVPERAEIIRDLPNEALTNELTERLMNILIVEFGESKKVSLVDLETGASFKISVWDPMHEMFCKNPYGVISAAGKISTKFTGESSDIIKYLEKSRNTHAYALAEFKHKFCIYNLKSGIDYSHFEIETGNCFPRQITKMIDYHEKILVDVEEFIRDHSDLAMHDNILAYKNVVISQLKNYRNLNHNMEKIVYIHNMLIIMGESQPITQRIFPSIAPMISLVSKIIANPQIAKELADLPQTEPKVANNQYANWLTKMLNVTIANPTNESNETAEILCKYVGDLTKALDSRE